MFRKCFPFVLLVLFLAVLTAEAKEQTFAGVITDTMCGASHAMMGKTPAPQCTVQCVKSNPKEIKYALAMGKKVYVLSDQQAPEKFAGRRVKVTGALDTRTRTIQVSKIEEAGAARKRP